jgi:hypothetical protein
MKTQPKTMYTICNNKIISIVYWHQGLTLRFSHNCHVEYVQCVVHEWRRGVPKSCFHLFVAYLTTLRKRSSIFEYRFWGPWAGTTDFFPGVQPAGREADQSLPSSAEVNNKWSCISIPHIPSWRTRYFLPYTVYCSDHESAAQTHTAKSECLFWEVSENKRL